MSAVLQTWYRGRAGAGTHAARSRGPCFTTAVTASFIIAVQDASLRIPPRIGGAAESGTGPWLSMLAVWSNLYGGCFDLQSTLVIEDT